MHGFVGQWLSHGAPEGYIVCTANVPDCRGELSDVIEVSCLS